MPPPNSGHRAFGRASSPSGAPLNSVGAEGAAPRCNRTERPPPGSSAAGRSVRRARALTRRDPRPLGPARRAPGLHPPLEAVSRSSSNEGAAPRRSHTGRPACRIRTGEPLPRTWGRSDGEEAEQNWAPLLLLDRKLPGPLLLAASALTLHSLSIKDF